MKNAICIILALYACAAVQAMPLGLRTAIWNVAAANGRSVRTEMERLLPADCEESQLPEVMEAFSDLMLVSHITNKTEYTEFRDWALDSGERADALAGSQTAWKSFAMALSSLALAPKDGDLKIDAISPSEEAGKIDIVFSLRNASVGVAAAEERLKAVFGVEGTATLDKNAFSSSGMSMSFAPTGDGRIKATVVPPTDAGNSFFMRVKMK